VFRAPRVMTSAPTQILRFAQDDKRGPWHPETVTSAPAQIPRFARDDENGSLRPSFVILSEAKDLSRLDAVPREILRCAQDDKCGEAQ
jgi:hypothetical protein